MKNLIIFTFFLCCTQVLAQNFSTGLVINDSLYNSTSLLLPFTKTNTPERYSLEDYCPKPDSQKRLPSCVGWSVGYAALTIEQAIKAGLNDQNTITANAYSALFLYNPFMDCMNPLGIEPEKALELLKNTGCIKKVNFEKKDVENCQLTPSNLDLEEAGKYKISSYHRLFNLNESDAVKIAAVEAQIAAKHPVIVGMTITHSMKCIGEGICLWLPEADLSGAEKHALCVVGYDKLMRRFTLMNSWGNTHAREGFVCVRYEDFAKYCDIAYSLSLEEENVQKETSLEARFAFEYPYEFQNEKAIFKESTVRFDTIKGHYISKGKWRVENQYRLLSSNVTVGSYVYMFSLDAKNKVEMHFPKIACELNIYGATETKIKPRNRAKEDVLIIPANEDNALELEHTGNEYACILYSPQPILEADICSSLNRLKNTEGDIKERFNKAFGSLISSESDITYSMDEMSFKAINNGKVIPIILEINVQ